MTPPIKLTSITLFVSLIFFLIPFQHHAVAKEKTNLEKKINKILSHRCARDLTIGIKVVNMTTGNILYSLNSDKTFLPASNLKIISSAAALKYLHGEYRFKTILSTDGQITDGVLKGNLYIKGFGDPKLVSEELWIIVKDLSSRGIQEISGNIIGDATYFDEKETGKGWGKRLSSFAYHAKVNALSLNFNTVAVIVEPAIKIGEKPRVTIDPATSYITVVNEAVTKERAKKNALTVDRVPLNQKDKIIVNGNISLKRKRKIYYRNISYPNRYLLTVFREFLERYGIKVSGVVQSGKQPEGVQELFVHESRPLGSIVRELNKMSNNFVAEQMVKVMGAELKGEPGTTEKGLLVTREFLEELGISEDQYSIIDGSGLSLLNRISPDLLITVLTSMYNDFTVGPEFIASLGVMGVDGSVEDRLKNSKAQRKIRAKTGTLNGAISLSGYAESEKGELLAFSMLANNMTCSLDRIMRLQDKIVLSIIKRR